VDFPCDSDIVDNYTNLLVSQNVFIRLDVFIVAAPFLDMIVYVMDDHEIPHMSKKI